MPTLRAGGFQRFTMFRAEAPDSSGLIGRLTLATTQAFTETDLLVTCYEIDGLLAQL